VHPIKRQHAVLDTVEVLLAEGSDVRLEFAGAISDVGYSRQLEARIARSPQLCDRVTFLGHVPRSELPRVASRWRAALLLSEQENFGHAVIDAAALGVPSVVSPGVGIGLELDRAGAGIVAAPDAAANALRRLLQDDRAQLAARCREFARRFAWPQVAADLQRELERRVR
jgi:D-inositol-3-phosphate glycosyltransferase